MLYILFTKQESYENISLQEFVDHWNHHILSSENNLSPLQLWTHGVLEHARMSPSVWDDMQMQDIDNVNDDNAFAMDSEDASVIVPEINIVNDLSDNQLEILQATISDFGDDALNGYLQSVNTLYDLMA